MKLVSKFEVQSYLNWIFQGNQFDQHALQYVPMVNIFVSMYFRGSLRDGRDK